MSDNKNSLTSAALASVLVASIVGALVYWEDLGLPELSGMWTVIIMGLSLYFLPTIIAGSRGHQNTVPIFLINLFLGLTLVGWVIALAWAFTAQQNA